MTLENTRLSSLYDVPKFKVDNELELTPVKVGELIDAHKGYQQRYNLLMDYYIGKHIIRDRSLDENKPNNRLIDNFAEYITNVKTGYFMGKPITYSIDDNTDPSFRELQMILKANNEQDANSELAKLMSIYGHAFELMYINEEPALRFRYLSPKNMFLVYGFDIEESTVGAVKYNTIQISKDEELVKVELYLRDKIVFMEGSGDDYTITKEVPHQFGQVPVIEYKNNDERIGDFESVITLIDAYEVVMSDSVNEVQYFNDAYLVLRNLMMTEESDIADMKNNRVISLDENGTAEWLTKNINDTHVQNVLDRIQTDIHRFSKTPNLTDENFASNLSGVAIRFKLWGLEQDAINKERKFKKGIQKRFQLISNFLGTAYKTKLDWLNINIIFSRNIPTNVLEQSQVVANLNGIVSHKTLLSVLPFIDDPQAEMELIKEEAKAQVDMFGFTETNRDIEEKETGEDGV